MQADAATVEVDGSQRETQRTADGQLLVGRHWPRPGARRGVLLVHGLGEHAGRYAHVAHWLQARGFDVLAYDQRGHGRSPGPRGALAHPDDLLDDLAAMYAGYAAHFDVALCLLGHSMGGLVALRAVLDRRIAPAALIVSSPALRTHDPPWKRRLAARLARWLPGLPLPNGLPFDKLSHDPAVVAAYRSDPLRHGTITPRLADFVFRAGAATIDDAQRLPVPTLLLVAGDDHLVDAGGSRDFAARAVVTGQLTTHVFEPLWHELFNEAEPARAQVMAVLDEWLARQG